MASLRWIPRTFSLLLHLSHLCLFLSICTAQLRCSAGISVPPPTTSKIGQHLKSRNEVSLKFIIECKMVQPLWKTVWQFFKKLNRELPYDPAIPLLGIYPKELESTSSDKAEAQTACTPVFIATLFTTAKRWKQPKCSSADEWINKIRNIYKGIKIQHKYIQWNISLNKGIKV